MEYISSVFSLVFFLGALLALFWGFYIIKIDKHSDINRMFLLVCISISIWCIGFAFANSVEVLKTALFWRRISALGWTTIYSITLHFLLLLTRDKKKPKMGKRIYLLYIPAIINIYIFSISNSMALLQYNLVKTSLGWTNLAVNNGWDLFYYLYYSLYMIVSMAVVWRWKKGLKSKIKIRQANLIFTSILVSAVLSSFTDIILTTVLARPLPQMAPLILLFPVGTMYYSARHYDLINYKKKEKNEIIVTANEMKKIFNNISLTIVISGLLNFIFEYREFIENSSHNLGIGIFKSIMLSITGIVIYLIQKIKKNSLREQLTILILVINIPIVTFNFLEYGGLTIWVAPIIIVISSLVFSKTTLLISITIMSILTQRLLWIIKPEARVVIDGYDYVLRIIMFITAFMVGFYVNKIYISKIKENDYQIRFQAMNSQISSDFITINMENRDEKVDLLLKKIGEFFEGDRCYVFLIDHENGTMTYSNEWINEDLKIENYFSKKILLSDYSWSIDKLKQEGYIYIEDINLMPEKASSEKKLLLKRKIKSLLSISIQSNDKIQGLIVIDSVSSFKIWTKEDIELLNIISNVLSQGLTKIKAEEEIEFMAYYDNLTQLPNRVLFKDRVEKAIKSVKQKNKLLSIIFVDLDNFKSVNDTIGHDGGDNLLKQVARKISKKLKDYDTVARFGGDEFMIMLNYIENQSEIIKVADDIMGIFKEAFIVDNQEFFITLSGGVATYPMDGYSSEALIKNADLAMYHAKAKGRNMYCLCTDKMKDDIERDIKLSNDLYKAIENEELIVYYQPQIDLESKAIIGIEALLRWNHPELGIIPPLQFIPLAEKNRLINSIGEWVLKTSCAQNKKLQNMDLAYIRIAVNLSSIQFMNPFIDRDVERVLKETKLAPEYLELEITESIAIKETDFAIDILNKLKDIGISIAIDDFGTEYSSLSRLKILPIDRIKIDREFIKGIGKNEKDRAIVMIIINLAKSLGINVLAEGVETAGELEFLEEKMCDCVQGYYYYKPMPAEELEILLKKLSLENNKPSQPNNL